MASTSDWIRKFAEDFVTAQSPLHLLEDFQPNRESSLNSTKTFRDQRAAAKERSAGEKQSAGFRMEADNEGHKPFWEA